MVVSSRGQLPALQTKAVDKNQHPLKTGSLGVMVIVCGNDSISLKPTAMGGDMADVAAPPTTGMNLVGM